MLGLTILGRAASTTVIGGAQHLWDDGQETVSALVFFTAVLAPALQIIFMLAIVLGARRKPAPRWVGTMLRHNRTMQTWSMIEVMMLGVLVALVKFADYATVIPGLALFVLGALVLCLRRCRRASIPGKSGAGSNGLRWEPRGPRLAVRLSR
jgi:paraquat-inducible protein A